MGEIPNLPEENSKPNSNPTLEELENFVTDVGHEIEGQEIEEDLDEETDLTPHEVEEIDKKLDALNLVLDVIEKKREDIHNQLLELLKSNQNIRMELTKKDSQPAQTGCGSSEQK